MGCCWFVLDHSINHISNDHSQLKQGETSQGLVVIWGWLMFLMFIVVWCDGSSWLWLFLVIGDVVGFVYDLI